tara:strand:+ start:5000 stop:5974 length:975 start_codon:yes stop_codon:yes gene_type:complete
MSKTPNTLKNIGREVTVTSPTSKHKLWLFGDSFLAEQPKNTPTEILKKTWYNQIGMLLHADIYNTAINGSSIEYLMMMLIENKDIMKRGDYAIFVLTEPTRKWFIEDRPDWGNLWMAGGYSQYPVKKVVQAIDDYKDHLANEAAHLSLFYGAVGFINHICKNKGIKFCILPSFRPHISLKYDEHGPDAWKHTGHNVTEVSLMGQMLNIIGDLTKISTEEFGDGDQDGDAKKVWHNIMQEKWRGCDQRLNHLTEPNHEILAKKVYNCLIMGHDVDLTSNFQKSVINEDNYRDINPDNIYNHVYSMNEIDEDNKNDELYIKKFKLF